MAKKTRPRGMKGPVKSEPIERGTMTESMRLAHESLRAEGIDPHDPRLTGPEAVARMRARRKAKGGEDERSARAYKAWETRRANGGIGSGREKRTCVLLTNELKQFFRAKGGSVAKGIRMAGYRWMKQAPLDADTMRTVEDERREAERQLEAEKDSED